MDSQSSALSAGTQEPTTAAITTSVSSASPTDADTDHKISGESNGEQTLTTSDTKEDTTLAPKAVKTATVVKSLTVDQRKQLRAQKFGDGAKGQSDVLNSDVQ